MFNTNKFFYLQICFVSKCAINAILENEKNSNIEKLFKCFLIIQISNKYINSNN